MTDNPKIATIVSIPFQENTYVVRNADRADCVVIDPGLEPGKIIGYIEEHDLEPSAILCTHGHSDHIGGNAALKDRWPECPLLIAAGDEQMLSDPNLNLSGPFGLPLTSPPADALLREGEPYSAAGLRFEVREIPGHSPGHAVLIVDHSQPCVVFGGDVLFQRSIGRCDFPGGSFEELRDGIHKKLFTLPDDTVVYPGHGPPTTVGEEKRHNPAVGEAAGYRIE